MRNTPETNYLFSALLFLAVSCTNYKTSIPFPEKMEGPQPVTKPLHFTEPTKLIWPGDKPVQPIVEKFDFDKLPSKPFDSSGFVPFSKPPEEVPFDFDKLPDTAFNYDQLPSKPLKFEISVLPPPQLIKTSLHLETASPQPVYELGEPFTGKTIWSVFEDSKGFLWISDQQGLYRYDGENLLLYLPGWSVVSRSIAEDSKGQIWIATMNNGVYVLNLESAIVKHLTEAGGLISNGTGRAIVDKQDRVWVTCISEHSEAWVCIIDKDLNTVKRFGFPQGLSGHFASRIVQDDQNNIWITTMHGGINIVDLKNGKLKYLNKRSGFISDSTSRILQDETGRIWFSDFYGAINAINIKAKSITHYSTGQGLGESAWISSLLNDGGNVCIATNYSTQSSPGGYGLCILNPEKKQFKILDKGSGLNSNDLNALLKDRRGQIWIATSNGLNMINRNGTIIEHTETADLATVAEDRLGRTWIGVTNAGIEIIDSATRSIRSFTSSSGLANDTVQNIRLIDGEICITSNGGIDFLDSNLTTITHLRNQQGSGFQGVLISKDSRGVFWISGSASLCGCVKGFDLYDPTKQTRQHLGFEEGIKDSAVLDIVEDRQGNIWFTSIYGSPGLIDPGRKTVKYTADLPGLSEQYNKLLLPDSRGNMWIGTGKGIYVVNRQGDSITSITTHEGLPDDNIFSLNQYNDRVYACTRSGLTIIKSPFLSAEKKWGFESFGSEQGFNKIFGSWEADMVTTGGRFLMADAGITSLSDNKRFTLSPGTEVTGINIFNRRQYFSINPWSSLNEKDTIRESNQDTFYVKGQLPQNIAFLRQSNIKYERVNGFLNMPVNLSLPYYQNFLQFHFTQVNGDPQDTTWYRYILEGADKAWSERTLIPSSKNYYALPPGNYSFKVSSSFNRQWSKPAAFSFVISPPWWRSWWAYILFGLALFGIIYVAVQYRSRKLKAANVALEEKINLRTAELKKSLQDLKATQTQLIHSEKMASLGELTAGIAHEIQNPLNFVNNFSEVSKELVEELKGEKSKVKGERDEELENEMLNDIQHNLEKIIHHGKRADAIVKGMLQHSRSSTGSKDPTNINALAEEYLRLSYHGLRAKDKLFNATIKTDFDESIGSIDIIPQDIGRVLLNLYNNAFYAVAEKVKLGIPGYEPTVVVSSKREHLKILVSVKDNGTGIPQKIADKIFQPFFTTKPTGEGTGLGLSLSYDIVKAHGGEIKVETKEGNGLPGEESGTEFKITLPA